jgi:hypothetical protein
MEKRLTRTMAMASAEKVAWVVSRARGETLVIGDAIELVTPLIGAGVSVRASISEFGPEPIDCVVVADTDPLRTVGEHLATAAKVLKEDGLLLAILTIGADLGTEVVTGRTLPEDLEPLPFSHIESKLVGSSEADSMTWLASFMVSPTRSTRFWAALLPALIAASDHQTVTSRRLRALNDDLIGRISRGPEPALPGQPAPSLFPNPMPGPAFISPVGYRRVSGGRLAMVGSVVEGRGGLDTLLRRLSEAALSPGIDLFGSVARARLPAGMSVLRGGLDLSLVERLRPYAGVIDHPALHETVTDRAQSLMALAAAGIPIAAFEVDHGLAQLIGEEMANLLGSARVTDLADPEIRDRLSVQLRRITLHQGSQTMASHEPAASFGISVTPLQTISILLPSNRPDFLDHALSQAHAQTYPETELVLILHGDGFHLTDSEIADRYHRPHRILRIPTAVVYGEALNRGTAASTGDLVTKMDDDDWYSPHHLWDLAHALHYSNADLVGKGAEFVYLSEIGITIRRMTTGAETYDNRNIGGGTFLMTRSALMKVGGWQRVPRHVDQALLNDLANRGMHWYRTHGHGYLLHRRTSGHTWDPGLDYFLDVSEDQYRGLDLDRAMVSE